MRLIVDAVGHRFGSLEVLDGISLDVAEGEILAVIGPSGYPALASGPDRDQRCG